ncbi:glycosyltransferase [Halopenitus persicus]|uniref:glycosyltransferase n=1 Tax=Halopenitus persicus TaxID=1048396 RepID=UPI000BBA7CAA|nr:glycosyltransferase [Halopenitus persicus]
MSEGPRLCYFTYGTNAGHYHYALNQLRGLYKSNPEMTIDIFYAGSDDESHFPEYVTESHFVYTGNDSKVVMVVRTLLLQIQLLLYFLRVRPDVVQINTHIRTQWYTLYITILLTILRIPVVRTVHERTDSRLGNVSPLARTIANRHFQLVNHLVTHTEALRQELVEDGIRTPISVIPHGNYLCFRRYIEEKAPSPYGETENPVILFFGVKEHKGIATFLDALECTETRFDPWIVGPINDGDESYAQRARTTENVNTHFKYIPDAELWMYFYFADIVALPYREGTTSGALQLALAFENVAVVSDLPCFTEYVTDGKTATIVRQPTPQDLADSLDTLVDQPTERQRLASAGFDLARSERFDWEHLADQIIEVYAGLVPENFKL